MRLRLLLVPGVAVVVLQLAGCTGSSGTVPSGGTYRSESAGAHFEQSVDLVVEGEVEDGATIAGLSLKGAHRPLFAPHTVYVAAGAAGLAVSDTGGQDWRIWESPLASTNDVVALESGVVVVAGVDSQGQGYIIRTIDEGRSWETVLTIPKPISEGGINVFGRRGGGQSVVIAIAPDPLNPERIYAGTTLGNVLLGEQSGKTWRTLHTLTTGRFSAGRQELLGIADIVPSIHTAGEMLLVTLDEELWRVSPTEQVELRVPEVIQDEGRSGRFTRARAIRSAGYVPGFPDALFVGVRDGAVLSRDRGVVWEELPLPVDTVQEFNTSVVTVSPTNPSRLLVGINGVVYRSEDGGENWNTFSLNLRTHVITSILIDPSNAANVLVVTSPVTS